MKAEDWISVKDRLPEVGQLVLVASHQYQDWMQPAFVLTYAGKSEICEGIEVDRWLDHRGQDPGYPTHWMPIVYPKND